MATTLTQICKVINTTDNKTKFEIASTVGNLLAGDLPSTDIFVYSIPDALDPKKDTFLRVGTILDLTTLPRGRSEARFLNASSYLSSSFTILFDDVHTSTAAKKVIQARVDQLIKDWKTYTTSFIIPDSFILPLTLESIVEAAKTAYQDALDASELANQSAVSTAEDLTDATAAAAAAATALTNAQIDSSACTQTQALLTAGVAAVNAFKAAADAFKSAAEAFQGSDYGSTAVTSFDTAKATYAAAVNTFLMSMPQLIEATSRVASSCAAKSALVTSLSAAKSAADATAATAQTSNTLAQAAAAAATAAKDSALDELLEVCPDFEA